MIGPVEKKAKTVPISAPEFGEWGDIDLRVLPKFICFRAAFLRERLTLQYVIVILASLFGVYFVVSRFEIRSLYKQLREKEFILAPGVQNFTPAMPQAVPDSYVEAAVNEFLAKLGNITSVNIDEQYRDLASLMGPELRPRFEREAVNFKHQVKADNTSELLSITQKEVVSRGDGTYGVKAFGRRDTYINNEYVGYKNEVIEMSLQLVPPQTGRPWVLQITELSRQSENAYRTKGKF